MRAHEFRVSRVAVEQEPVRVDHSDVSISLEECDLPAQHIRIPDVIVVEEADQIATCRLDSTVARWSGPSCVLEPKVSDRRPEGTHDCRGVVGRAVIADDDLEVPK